MYSCLQIISTNQTFTSLSVTFSPLHFPFISTLILVNYTPFLFWVSYFSSKSVGFCPKSLVFFHSSTSKKRARFRLLRVSVFLSVMKSMVDRRRKHSSGYGRPPWIFKGSALYQLHLVKAETVRACIPKEFRLVEAFGYTLGGFFLASYDDSPAGVFDELVVIAGLVWNPPTSCAWTTKVLVNSDEACDHGRKEVGLPSQVARFSKRITTVPKGENRKTIGFLNMIGMGAAFSDSRDSMDVQVTEVKAPSLKDSCSFNLTTIVPAFNSKKWMGPEIKMSLPSFSGRTEYTSNLLKYSCKIECRVRAVHPARVSGPASEKEQSTEVDQYECQNLNVAVMLSKPILALKFSCMTLQVEAPVVVSNCSKNSLRTC